METQNTPNEEIVIELQELNKTHAYIASILRIIAMPEIESRLSHIFTSNAEMSAYELANGDNSSRDAAKHIDLSFKSITKLWAKWADDGLLEISGKGTHKIYNAKYSLPELAVFAGKEKGHV